MILSVSNTFIPVVHLNYLLRKEGIPVRSIFNQIIAKTFFDDFWLMVESEGYDKVVIAYSQLKSKSVQTAREEMAKITLTIQDLVKMRRPPEIIICLDEALKVTAASWYLLGVNHFAPIEKIEDVIRCVKGECRCQEKDHHLEAAAKS